MQWQYDLSIAEVKLRLETDHPLVCNQAFHPFLTTGLDPDFRAVFEPVDRLPDDGDRYFYEKPDSSLPYAATSWDPCARFLRVLYLKQNEHCVSELQNCFYHIGIETLMIRKDRLCFHAACIETQLGGILFSGPSGIGKSTQAALWETYQSARQINGDRPILQKRQEGWAAWGSPYAGSSHCHVNDHCPVTAIVMLRKAEDCSVRRLSLQEAFRAVWSGITIHSEDVSFVEKASDLVIALIGMVPVYEFSCTPDEYAVKYLEQELRKEWHL